MLPNLENFFLLQNFDSQQNGNITYDNKPFAKKIFIFKKICKPTSKNVFLVILEQKFAFFSPENRTFFC